MFEFLKRKKAPYIQSSTQDWQDQWRSLVPPECRNVPVTVDGVSIGAERLPIGIPKEEGKRPRGEEVGILRFNATVNLPRCHSADGGRGIARAVIAIFKGGVVRADADEGAHLRGPLHLAYAEAILCA